MHSRLRRAYTAFAEQRYTKLAAVTCRSRLDLIIAKATSPDDLPLPDHYVWELTIAFSSSPSLSRTFALSFTRRFGQTKSWRVALKSLLLLHLLLRRLPSDHPFRVDILSARANALISLHPCHFNDSSSSNSEDYTVFVRSYARLIDEVMNCNDSTKDEALQLVQQLQSLMDLAMECVPTGPSAARSLIVRSTMRQVARESFACYLAAQQSLSSVLDGILQMPYRSCIEGLGVYKRAAEQAVRLGEFYQWCREMGYCAQYEYPIVDKIPKIQVLMLEAFVEQTWQPMELSSSTSSPTAEVQGNGIVISEEWEKFEEESDEGKEEEEKALIKFEDDETSWEVILDASINWPWCDLNMHEPWRSWGREDEEELRSEKDEKSLQLFNPHLFNPFFWS